MRTPIKKTIAVFATAAAIGLGSSAVANAADREVVPDVAGMTVPQAIAAFDDAGFTNIAVNVKDSTEIVISSNLQPGTKINDNTAVLIIVPSH